MFLEIMSNFGQGFNESSFQQMFTNQNFKEIFFGSALGGLLGLLIGIALILLIVILIAGYVYMAIVWQTIAKKLGYKKSWLAWIPIANLFLIPILAKKHWCWGWFILLPPVYFVLAIIWIWKIYEKRNYPGWLSLFLILWIVPMLKGLGMIANLVIFGIVAWKDRKGKNTANIKKKKR